MESSFTQSELYSIPFYQQAKLKRSLHIIFCFLIIIFLGFVLIPGKDQEKIILNVFFLLLAAFIGFGWLAMVFFNKSFLKITDENLEYKALFGKHKVISLKSIYQVEFFTIQGASLLGIRTNSELQEKQSILKKVDRFFGYGHTVTIPLSAFSNIDFDKLAVTIISKANENNSVNELN